MNEKMKNIMLYAVLFVLLVIIPSSIFYYFKRSDAAQFNQWVNEDNERCYERAKRDSVDKEWCNEIRSASKLTYNEAVSSSNPNLVLMIFQPLLFVLLITVHNLKKQVEELKKSENL